jgi:hypothetical protein
LNTLQDEPHKSEFVTVLAWIFIVLTGFCVVISVLQNIMIQTMFSPEMHRAAAIAENMPFFAQFMFDNIRWFFIAFLVLSISTFVSSIGLLKRKNWARLFFIAIMALGIVWNIGGFALQLALFSLIPKIPSGAPDALRSQFDAIFVIVVVFSALMAVGLSVLFGWIIKRLLSLPVQREFGAAS